MPGASPSGGVQIAKKLTNGFPPSVPEALAMGADERIDEVVGAIKAALNVDASVTLSAYDMAWIGRIPGTNCSTACRVPHFPQAIEWIRDNQLPDGSWEESRSTSAFERALATLASLVSLKTWGAAPESVMKGELFLQNCLSTMKPSDLKFVCAGFTHAFAALMEESSKVEIALPHANVFLDGLRSKRNQLLVSLRQVESIKRWPRKLLRFPEGFQEAIPWEEIRQLQSCDGGLFASPAATACFAMNTGNSKALCYLSAVLKRSRCTEPTASLDRVSGVLHLLDHLERLNIDCHFHAEIGHLLDALHRWDLSLVEDCSKEVKIVASGLLRSMDSECVDASAVQGRDLSHFFRRICRDLARSMMTEFEWSAAGHIPSTKEYLDTSVTSFATGPIVFVAAFFLGDLISEEMLDSDEYWDAFYSMSLFGRLINDISSVSRDSERGHNSAITVYLQEHPGQREEDALMAIKDMVTASASSALSKLLDPNFACSPIRVACLGLMRALFVMYHRNEDGFTNTPSDLKQKIERLFYVPFPTV